MSMTRGFLFSDWQYLGDMPPLGSKSGINHLEPYGLEWRNGEFSKLKCCSASPKSTDVNYI
jgi:hypothetical protein